MATFDASKLNLPFMKYRKIAMGISLVAILVSIGSLFVNGLNPSVDFTGGLVMHVKFEQPADVGAVRASLSNIGQGQAIIQAFSDHDIMIRLHAEAEDVRREALGKLQDDLGKLTVLRIDKVGPVVGKELRKQAIISLVLALSGILVYMAFRFRFRFGMAAVLSLVHDSIIMLGVYSLLQKEISVAFIAAILTVIGYSLNDSIVVLDRVRENWPLIRTKGVLGLIDNSINQTLSRTVNTSVTTLLPVLAMYFFGGEVISNFAFAFLIGIVVGTYSSVYISSAILADWYLRSPKY